MFLGWCRFGVGDCGFFGCSRLAFIFSFHPIANTMLFSSRRYTVVNDNVLRLSNCNSRRCTIINNNILRLSGYGGRRKAEFLASVSVEAAQGSVVAEAMSNMSLVASLEGTRGRGAAGMLERLQGLR